MKILPEAISFEWNKGNIDKNLKHAVTNKETEEIFSNKPLFVSEDIKHSTEKEKRYQALGITNENKQLFISFTFRGEQVRVISARLMSRKERRTYEKKIKDNTKI